MSLKAKLEAIIYAAEEPVTLEQMIRVVKDDAVAEIPRPDDGAAPDPAAVDDEVRSRVRAALQELVAECDSGERGMEIREVAGGYRMSTKPEHHDVVRAFVKSLKPPIKLSLPALETLAVVAYKQPVTAPEIGEIRGVDSSGVVATLLQKKLITTAGRKQVVGRPMLYRTSKEFLLRFGLKDVGELPSIEEFEKLVSGDMQEDLFAKPSEGQADATPAAPTESSSSEISGSESAGPEAVIEEPVSEDPAQERQTEKETAVADSQHEGSGN